MDTCDKQDCRIHQASTIQALNLNSNMPETVSRVEIFDGKGGSIIYKVKHEPENR